MPEIPDSYAAATVTRISVRLKGYQKPERQPRPARSCLARWYHPPERYFPVVLTW
jgi:hypothetical protein